MIRIAICDDEPYMMEQLSEFLFEYQKERQAFSYDVHCFESGTSLLNSKDCFDLIFLDIQMDGPDGMETAKRLQRQKKDGLLVFVTAFQERVFEAFEVQAYDYLVKPLASGRFARTMDRALETLEQRTETSLLIQKGNSCQVVLLEEIVYCEVWGRKVYIHQKDGTVIDYYEKLKQLEQYLDNRFFRCHRSYLVNLDYVCGCREGEVFLSQGGNLPVSKLRERDLAQAILRHMKERN